MSISRQKEKLFLEVLSEEPESFHSTMFFPWRPKPILLCTSSARIGLCAFTRASLPRKGWGSMNWFSLSQGPPRAMSRVTVFPVYGLWMVGMDSQAKITIVSDVPELWKEVRNTMLYTTLYYIPLSIASQLDIFPPPKNRIVRIRFSCGIQGTLFNQSLLMDIQAISSCVLIQSNALVNGLHAFLHTHGL